MSTISIVSERLLFRTLTLADATSRYADWLNDPEVNQYLETRFSLQTVDSCRAFIQATAEDPYSHLFGIFDKVTLQHIGNIKLGFINKNHQSGELSLFIGEKPFWRKGYATESIRSITKWGFETLDLERIEAGCYDTNLGSLRAFLNAGYSVEGFFRKAFVSKGVRIGCFWLGILRNDPI